MLEDNILFYASVVFHESMVLILFYLYFTVAINFSELKIKKKSF